jgi:hypothetical protein
MRDRLMHVLTLVGLYSMGAAFALLAGFIHYAFLAFLLN